MIRLSISFYGEIADRLGRERVMAFAADDITVGEIRAELAQQDEAAAVLLKPQIRAAVDSRVVGDEASVKAGQEVVFFSIVSGG
ncbi:MoaD/ThiS family protein [Brevundimonas aveniformis]|uniref:MoaD/ThiS family protein n=1 Tax=Brevundimonas aveniformis TaxID=370977 RepID=UPI00042A79A0|nr:MoaD/ThiS family protein [Brevundimonas aveniformis]